MNTIFFICILSLFSVYFSPFLCQFSSVAQSCQTLCDPMVMPGFWLPCPSPASGACSNSYTYIYIYVCVCVCVCVCVHICVCVYTFSLPTKVRLVKVMVFPVVLYGCGSWTVKKAEHRRIDSFELWCWRRLLRVPWTSRRSNQSILKEISFGCSLERLMLKLKLQYFGHLMQSVDSLEKTLMLGGIGDRRRRV